MLPGTHVRLLRVAVVLCRSCVRTAPSDMCAVLRCSGPERKASYAVLPRPVRSDERGPSPVSLLPIGIHLAAAAGRTLPDLQVRLPVPAEQQHHGH